MLEIITTEVCYTSWKSISLVETDDTLTLDTLKPFTRTQYCTSEKLKVISKTPKIFKYFKKNPNCNVNFTVVLIRWCGLNMLFTCYTALMHVSDYITLFFCWDDKTTLIC